MADSFNAPRPILPAGDEKSDPLHAIARRLIPLVHSNPDRWREAVRRWADDPPLHGDGGVLPVPFPETLTPDERIAILAAIYDAKTTNVARIDPWPSHVLPPTESSESAVVIPGEYRLAMRYQILVRDRVPRLSEHWGTHEAAIELFISETTGVPEADSMGGTGPMAHETKRHLNVGQELLRLLSVFSDGLSDERFLQAAAILSDDKLYANDKLTNIDKIIRLPAKASAERLGKLIGVTAAAVKKTMWWQNNRYGKKAEEIESRKQRLIQQGSQFEHSQPGDGEA